MLPSAAPGPAYPEELSPLASPVELTLTRRVEVARRKTNTSCVEFVSLTPASGRCGEKHNGVPSLLTTGLLVLLLPLAEPALLRLTSVVTPAFRSRTKTS